MANVLGTDNSETIDYGFMPVGVTDDADGIFAGGGNDTIYGRGGNDIIHGGLGGDTIDGGDGDDWAAYIDSEAGVVVTLELSFGYGWGYGGTAEGDRMIRIENLYGSDHNDVFFGDGNANELRGNKGADVLKGGGGADNLYGGDGDDMLEGGSGGDYLHGGVQNDIDTAVYTGSDAGVVVSLITNRGSGGDADGDRLYSIENISGSNYHDTLSGNDGVNVLEGWDGFDRMYGYGGADRLTGGAGGDTLDGGSGDDTMIGGLDSDAYYVDSMLDMITENPGEGTDIVYTSVNHTLAANVDWLFASDLGSTAPLSLTGNNLQNRIFGNNGDNVISGGGDHDSDLMYGYGGNDQYTVDSIWDGVFEYAGGGRDTVSSPDSYWLPENVEDLSLNIGDGVYGEGNGLANLIYGGAGTNNRLDGRGGVDELNGLGGAASNDTYIFRANEAYGDKVYDFAGNGAAAGDMIELSGFTSIRDWGMANVWEIRARDGHLEYITIYVAAGGSFDPMTDVAFV
jgi:serralysin